MTELRRQKLQSWRDTNNCTTTPLAGDATFTGTSTEMVDVGTIRITIYTDVASATDGLDIQFSNDNSNWYNSDYYTIGAGSYKTYSLQPVDRYFRVVYTNGSDAQTTFHIDALLLTGTIKPSSHRLGDNLSQEDDATLSKAVIAATLPSGQVSNVNATAAGALRVNISGENQDAFGRVRVSEPSTMIDSTFAYDLSPKIYEDISTGNGSVTHDSNARAASMVITAGSAGTAGIQSYQYAHYHPGRSQLVFMTFCADVAGATFDANQKFEVGYFDDDNGVFLRADSDGLHMVRRSSTSGSPVDTEVDQASWNIDTMDGSGNAGNPSGITVDITKSQILVVDLQFLGVGRIRIGLDISGVVFFAHEFQFANTAAGMYMQMGTLPIRWLLTDTGTTGFDDAQAYCAMVTSEGAPESDRGIPLAQGNTSAITAANGTDTHLISIRPSLTFNSIANRAWNILEEAQILVTGNAPVIVKIWYDATVTGGSWVAVDASDSGMEYNITASHAAGTGVKLSEFYVAATAVNKAAGGFAVANKLPITIDAAGTGYVGVISVTAQGIGATSATWAALNWREIR